MKNFTPFSVAFRVIFYSLLMAGIAQGIKFDALHPRGKDFFGEITFTEITQEFILFFLFLFYLFLGYKVKPVRAVSNLVSMFFLISFIREFNFLLEQWVIPALFVLAAAIILVIRDYKKIRPATIRFFDHPASAWFFSGFLVTYIFSRLFGRSAFWKLLYHDESYRLAKAAVEEGTELLGCVIMMIGALEWIIYIVAQKREEK